MIEIDLPYNDLSCHYTVRSMNFFIDVLKSLLWEFELWLKGPVEHAVVVEWQTRCLQAAVLSGVRVQLPPTAPDKSIQHLVNFTRCFLIVKAM